MIGALLVTCADERILSPVAQPYRVLVSTWGPQSRVFAFDGATDALIDSTIEAQSSSTVASFTADGKYFFRFNKPTCPELWDASTLTRLAVIPGCARFPLLAMKDGLILSTGLRRIVYSAYPSLDSLYSDSLSFPGSPEFRAALLDDDRGLLYGTATFDSAGATIWEELVGWDYRDRTVYNRWDMRKILGTQSVIVTDVALNYAGDQMFVVTRSSVGSQLFRLDLKHSRLLWEESIPNAFATLELTPDGAELWRGHRAGGVPASIIPYIYIHDPMTGEVIDTVSLRGLLETQQTYPAIQDLKFSPDGTKAYAATGDEFHLQESGPVLVISVAARQVIGALLSGKGHYPHFLDIGPIL